MQPRFPDVNAGWQSPIQAVVTPMNGKFRLVTIYYFLGHLFM